MSRLWIIILNFWALYIELWGSVPVRCLFCKWFYSQSFSKYSCFMTNNAYMFRFISGLNFMNSTFNKSLKQYISFNGGLLISKQINIKLIFNIFYHQVVICRNQVVIAQFVEQGLKMILVHCLRKNKIILILLYFLFELILS